MHRVIKIMKIKSSIKRLQSCLCTIWSRDPSERIACDHILHVHKGEVKLHKQSQFCHLPRTENFTDMNFPVRFFPSCSFYWEVWSGPLHLEKVICFLLWQKIANLSVSPDQLHAPMKAIFASCKHKLRWITRGKWHARFQFLPAE